MFFEPVPDAAIVLGIDIGARYLRAAIADLSGAIRARQDVELHGADAAGVLASWTRCEGRCSRRRAWASTWSTPPSSACRAWSGRGT